MGKVVTSGEIMMRLNPVSYGRFGQARSFEASFTGRLIYSLRRGDDDQTAIDFALPEAYH